MIVGILRFLLGDTTFLSLKFQVSAISLSSFNGVTYMVNEIIIYHFFNGDLKKNYKIILYIITY